MHKVNINVEGLHRTNHIKSRETLTFWNTFSEITGYLVYSGFNVLVRFNISGVEKILVIFLAKRVDNGQRT